MSEELVAAATTIEIDDIITVGTLAERLSIPVSRLISELMKNGIMATVNEKLDYDTAQIIVDELDLGIKLQKKKSKSLEVPTKTRSKNNSSGQTRPPVVAVMGHVDHGKTSLLDAIRESNVIKSEAGGITQHISAYQIDHNGRTITFLDTPGHEAFAAIREHGALLTDIVIIVVAADDGVKPQTIEAIRFAKKAGARIIVAINKIDKEGADANKVKQQLSENGLLIEEWGGDIVAQLVSAKTKEGIPELLDVILLVSDIEELKADYNTSARGLVIESHVQQGLGPVAQALIEEGTLKTGQFIVAGSTYAKVKNLKTTKDETTKEATPSMPVIISGFKSLPEFGDEFRAVEDEKEARSLAAQTAIERQSRTDKMDIGSNELIRLINRDRKLQELNIIIKADVQGSLTSVIDSLKALDTDEVAIRIVGSGIGPVGENDLYLAHTSGAIIYGFNVAISASSKQQASRDKVKVRLYKVIYELIDDVKEELSTLLSPEIVENELGTLLIKGVFKTTKTEVICGGEVTKGKLKAPALARVIRDKAELATVELVGLRKGPSEVKEVVEGEMCGMNLKTTKKLEIQEGDRIEIFTREAVQRKL